MDIKYPGENEKIEDRYLPYRNLKAWLEKFENFPETIRPVISKNIIFRKGDITNQDIPKEYFTKIITDPPFGLSKELNLNKEEALELFCNALPSMSYTLKPGGEIYSLIPAAWIYDDRLLGAIKKAGLNDPEFPLSN